MECGSSSRRAEQRRRARELHPDRNRRHLRQRALDDHILDPEVRAPIDAETQLIVQEIGSHSGPFSQKWIEFRANPDWTEPTLPAAYAWGGAQWELPMGERLLR